MTSPRPRKDRRRPTSTGRLRVAPGLAALLAVGACAQLGESSRLSVGRAHRSTLGAEAVDEYTLEAGEGFFVAGAVDQLTTDVVVKVFDADGEELAEIDGPARGLEYFQFEAPSAGTYRIEVAPAAEREGEAQAGDYEITLRRAEPPAATPEDRVDQLMTRYDDAGTPGGVVAVVVDGQVTFARSYGAANLTHDIPFEVDTRTNIGSTSKQFVTYAILLLAAQGKLGLDDDVREHVEELPDLGETVTVRHLMTHTSGYREFFNLLAMTGRRIIKGDFIDRSEVIRVVQRQTELQNSPGAEFNYNNTAYSLLATIVERTEGVDFPEWMAENVFRPLGMNDTFVRESPVHVIPNSAQGYTPGEDGYVESIDLGAAVGAGSIYTTVGDLAKWVRNYRTGELGGPEIFVQMSTPYELTSGEATEYGFGLFVDEYRGLGRVHHGGADTAHRSMLMYFPSLDAAVITQSNNASFAGEVAAEVAEAFFGGEMEPEVDAATQAAEDAFDPKAYDAASFDRFTGRYEVEAAPEVVLSFTREGEDLYLQVSGKPRVSLAPTSPARFEVQGVQATVTFHEGDDGAVDSLTLSQNGEYPAKRLTEEPFSPTPEQLGVYAGRYYCDELETWYEVAVVEDSLVLRIPRFDEMALEPSSPHHFSGDFPVTRITFEANESGAITSLIAGNGRTRGLRFERQD